jgi:RimJ/RimL family protein N-acetyltransferase
LHKLLLDIPTRLDTERLTVRKYAEGDGRDLYLLLERNDNRQFLRENVENISSIKTESEAEIKVRTHSAEWFARDRIVMGIWLKSENRYVGEILIEPKKWEVPSFETMVSGSRLSKKRLCHRSSSTLIRTPFKRSQCSQGHRDYT